MAYGNTDYRGDAVRLDGMLRTVIALHRPSHGYCVPCDEDQDIEVDGNNPDCPHQVTFCSECSHRWPCATITAATTGPAA